MRRLVFETVGPFAGIEVAEDRDWGHRATRLGYKVHYVPNMIVFHPARKSFSELYAKWDRAMSHDFAEYSRGPLGRLRWAFRTLAVAGSPIFEARRILRSDRVSTGQATAPRGDGFGAYPIHTGHSRCFGFLIRGARAGSSASWNRA